jgi:hypothetical protein
MEKYNGRRVADWTPSMPRFSRRRPMKTRLTCPCGESFVAADEDNLVTQVQAHLADAHPGLEYDREQILFIAT